MFVGILIYGGTLLMAAWTYVCYVTESREGFCSLTFLRLGNYLAHFMRGFFGAVFVFAGQYQYIDKITTQEEKKEIFGIFTQIFMSNGIFGNLMNLVLYTFKANSLICFIGFSIAYFLAAGGLLVLQPSIKGYDPYAKANEMQELTALQLDPGHTKTTTEDRPAAVCALEEDSEPKAAQIMKSLRKIEPKEGDEGFEDLEKKQNSNNFVKALNEDEHADNLKDRLIDDRERELDDHGNHISEESGEEDEDMQRKPSLGNTTVSQSIKNMWTLMFHPKI